MLDAVPKMCGKELEKEGEAWMEAKWILPMLSLTKDRIGPGCAAKNHADSRVVESKGGFCLVDGYLTGDLRDIPIEGTANVVIVAENEGLLDVKSDSYDIPRIPSCKFVGLLGLELVFE